MIRHLLFDCCALKDTAPAWGEKFKARAAGAVETYLNVRKIIHYKQAFNGRKIIILRVGENVYSPDEAMPWFSELEGVQFVERKNDPFPGLREASEFDENLRLLESTSPDEAFFFAHSKGVSRSDPLERYAIRQWRDTMYDKCLKNPDKIDKLLQTYACVGCYRTGGSPAGCPRATWHYPGTFFWIKSDRLFSKPDWDNIPKHRYAAEGFPGYTFEFEESAALYKGTPMNLYMIAAPFICGNCGARYEGKQRSRRKQVCPHCHKRQAKVDMDWLDAAELKSIEMAKHAVLGM